MPQPDEVASESDQILKNIEAVSNIYEKAEMNMGPAQRGIERAVRVLGRPRFLYLLLGLVAVWIIVNVAMFVAGRTPFDPAPFFALQGLVGLSSMVLATLIVITQNRQSQLAERRAHIDLQVNLLAEKKIAKVISLLEELRRDLPSVTNRVDPEAAAMQTPADPQLVAKALADTPALP